MAGGSVQAGRALRGSWRGLVVAMLAMLLAMLAMSPVTAWRGPILRA